MKTFKQTEIAKKANISDGFLSEILAGKKSPSWGTAKKLSKTTGIPVTFWMESRNKPEKLKRKIKATLNNQLQDTTSK